MGYKNTAELKFHNCEGNKLCSLACSCLICSLSFGCDVKFWVRSGFRRKSFFRLEQRDRDTYSMPLANVFLSCGVGDMTAPRCAVIAAAGAMGLAFFILSLNWLSIGWLMEDRDPLANWLSCTPSFSNSDSLLLL